MRGLDQPARRGQHPVALLGVDPARRRLRQRPRDGRLGGGPRDPGLPAEHPYLAVVGPLAVGDRLQGGPHVRPLCLDQIGQVVARRPRGPRRPQRVGEQAERPADQRVDQARPRGRERVRADRVQQEHDDRGDERETDREARREQRVPGPRERADEEHGHAPGRVQRDRDRSRQPDAERGPAEALGAARERGAELGAERGGGRDDHPVAPAQRQVTRDQLGEQHHDREAQRVTTGRRLETDVRAEYPEAGAEALDRAVGARLGAAVAPPAGLAGAHGQRPDRAQLPRQGGQPPRQHQPRGLGRERMLRGVRAQPRHVRG